MRPPLPLFLEEYDSTGVRWWGCAKNIIRWGLAGNAEVFSSRLHETRQLLRVFLTQSSRRSRRRGKSLAANMEHFTMNIYRMSSKFVVTVRIGAEVVEKGGTYEFKRRHRRNE